MTQARRKLFFFAHGIAISAILASLVTMTFARAADLTPAEDFVQRNLDRGVQILTNKSLSSDDRRARVEEFLGIVMNTRKLAIFCLGPTAQTASRADIDAFTAAFATFTVARYSSQLGSYDGQSLKVVGASERSATDHVVTAILVDPAQPSRSEPIMVLFRVLNDGDKYGIVDASIEEFWFGLAERDDIQGFLTTNNNDITKLTERLDRMAADLNSQRAATP